MASGIAADRPTTESHYAGVALFLHVFLPVYAGLLIASAANLIDPMVRHDDFPALLADGARFYDKTLNEGRWVNYWWHLRGIAWPAWANYLLYQALWACFAAAAALNCRGRDGQLWYTIVLGWIIVLAPAALLISLWYNTLILGLALVALYAVLAERSTLQTARLMLLPFVPLTLMAYTTYPLLLLVICLSKHDAPRGAADLTKTLSTFVLSFALGVLAIYSINWAVHGVFGVPMAAWRAASPATDVTSAVANLGQLWDFILKTAMVLAFNFPVLVVCHCAALLGALALLARHAPWEAAYLISGIVIGLALLAAQAISSGVSIPARTGIFLWVFYCILIMRGAIILRGRGRLYAPLGRIFLLAVIASYTWQSFAHSQKYLGWQAMTRDIAGQIGPGTKPVYIWGDVMALPEAMLAGIQRPRALSWRLEYLTGRHAYLCAITPADCAQRPPPATVADWVVDGDTLILPDGP